MEDGCLEAIFVAAFWVAAAVAIAGLAVFVGGAILVAGLLVGLAESCFRFGQAFLSGFWSRADMPSLSIPEGDSSELGYFFGPGFADIAAAVDDGESGRRLAAQRFANDSAAASGIAKYSLIAWNAGGLIGVGVGDLLCRAVLQLPALAIVALSGVAAGATAAILRGGQRVAALVHRVGYSCANDGCYARGLEPVYACPSCGAPHECLWPGKYGVFVQTCRCGTGLPTLALLGRRKLTACCRACGAALSGGETSDVHLVVAGATGSGRARVALGLIDSLSLADASRPRLVPTSPSEYAAYKAAAGSSAGVSDTPKVVVLSHECEGSEAGHSLYVYDSPAESAASSVAEQAYYNHIDAIMFSVSVEQVSAARSRDRGAATTMFPELDEAYAKVLKTLDTHSGQAGAAMRRSRMAIVLSDASRALGDKALELADSADRAARGRSIRDWLISAGEGNFVRLVEGDFKKLHYYVAPAWAGEASLPSSTPYPEIVEWLLAEREFAKWGMH